MKEQSFTEKVALPNGTIRLTILVGNGQIGSSFVFFKGKLLAKGSIEGLELGASASLSGQKLHIETIVTDINPSTDNTVVTYIFRSQTQETAIEEKIKAATNGKVLYDSDFSF
jgi:hypothetical protein